MSKKSKIEAICTWGDGPDILLRCSDDPKDFHDLTLKEAEELVMSLQMAIMRVKDIEQSCEDYGKEKK